MATIKASNTLDSSFFKSLKILSELGDEYILYLLEHALIKRYDKGKLLFLQGDPVTTVYIIRSGWVKLFRNTVDGTEVITSLCKEGDLFSKSAMVGKETHPTCAQVVEEAIVYEIPARILKESIKRDLKLALNVISYLSTSINLLDKQVEHLAIMNADQRLACFLLHLCTNAKGPSVKIKLPCNKELIANHLGMKPETFSRSIPKLRPVGVVEKSDHIEINDINTLRNYTCVSCTSAGACIACPASQWNVPEHYYAS